MDSEKEKQLNEENAQLRTAVQEAWNALEDLQKSNDAAWEVIEKRKIQIDKLQKMLHQAETRNYALSLSSLCFALINCMALIIRQLIG